MNFQAFYNEHDALVWRALHRLGVPAADLPDAVQEVFLVAYQFEGRSKASTWLVGICCRVASDRRRLAHVRREIGDMDAMLACGDERPGADQLVEQQEQAHVLDEILALLRPEQREVFVMFELEELSGKEIAAIVGAPLKTVFSRLRLARTAFTTALTARQRDGNRVASRSVACVAARGKEEMS
jgi:RNA polymerase sigma-70 factor (ECF subfamily)